MTTRLSHALRLEAIDAAQSAVNDLLEDESIDHLTWDEIAEIRSKLIHLRNRMGQHERIFGQSSIG